MKTTFRSLALIVVSIFTVVNIQAQTRSVGLNAMQFLNVGVGARSAAMGLSTTAVSNDVDQIFYNPAGSALKDEMLQASVNYTSWLMLLIYMKNRNPYGIKKLVLKNNTLMRKTVWNRFRIKGML